MLGLFNYWIVIFLMMTGFYIVISRGNLIKKVIGLNIFQTAVFLLYITMGKVHGGTAPIFAGVGFAALLAGGNFLEYAAFAEGTAPGNHIGIWLVELGVGVTVSAVMVTIFLSFAGRER